MKGTTRSSLPEWMLNPPPPRLTLTQRLTAPVTRTPRWKALQQRWWRWQDRTRLYDRYPTTFKITAFFVSWLLAMVLLSVAYTLFALS